MTPDEIKMLIIGVLIGLFVGQMSVIMLAAFMSANKEKKHEQTEEREEISNGRV
jgi:ethanolamine transporter EutH